MCVLVWPLITHSYVDVCMLLHTFRLTALCEAYRVCAWDVVMLQSCSRITADSLHSRAVSSCWFGVGRRFVIVLQGRAATSTTRSNSRASLRRIACVYLFEFQDSMLAIDAGRGLVLVHS